MSKRYPIRTMADFNAIPIDRLDAFAKDMVALVYAVVSARQMGAAMSDRVIEWIDDDHSLSINVVDPTGVRHGPFELERQE